MSSINDSVTGTIWSPDGTSCSCPVSYGIPGSIQKNHNPDCPYHPLNLRMEEIDNFLQKTNQIMEIVDNLRSKLLKLNEDIKSALNKLGDNK